MLAVQGRTTEKTFCSRMRRAISCEYWAPKSRTTIDWVSTDECLKLGRKCKEGIGCGSYSLIRKRSKRTFVGAQRMRPVRNSPSLRKERLFGMRIGRL